MKPLYTGALSPLHMAKFIVYISVEHAGDTGRDPPDQ